MGFKEDLVVEEEYFYDQTFVSDNCCDAAELYCYNVKPIAVQRHPVKAVDLKQPIVKTPDTPQFPITSRSFGDVSFGISYGFEMNSFTGKFSKLGNVSKEITAREHRLISTIKEEADAIEELTQRLNRMRRSATLRFTSAINWS